ncbi:MAG: FAD-dependent oxidoreductase [Oscillospiraceae bacterium]|nr:FAD-dependent oxidoreductase [Oscillospiraceae bacterium]
MKLFEEIKIGSMTLKNRVVLAPMGTTTDHTNGFNMRDVNFYAERARGGAGLILTGAVVASTEFEPAPCQKLTSNKDVYMLHMVAERVHMYGAKFGIQLSPGIGRMNWIDPHTPPYSASPCPNYYKPELICREMPTEGVKSLVRAMGESAKLAKAAGVDIIEIHAYGGYLIDQFTSAKWNHRTDEYGGSFENRQRFLMEIVDSVRAACGKDYPIAVKMTLDSVDDEERPIEEGLAIAKRLAEKKVDLIHFGRGAYSCRWRMVSSVYQPVGFDLDAADKVRAVIGDIPLMVHGKLNHAEVAEAALQKGTVDLVAIGHGMIADPHWANKVRKNKLDEIVPCIGCGECHFNAMKGRARPCAVNPLCMHENEFELTPAKESKRVLVIGAGPGGMKAAAAAAQRGFDVALWEKNDYMGGIMAAAGAPRFKKDVKDQVEYLIRQVYKNKIDVCLGKTATLEDVKEYNPDFVIVATGANPVVIPVPGYEKPNVSTAVPVLLKQRAVGQRVVVVGGGEVGCELSTELYMQGKDVTMVEILPEILLTADHFVANDQNIRYLVEHSGVNIMTGTKLTEVLDDGVMVEIGGEKKKIGCDSVVFAAGFRPDHSLYRAIKDAGFEVVQIGDNIKPGKVIDAIHQGYHTIRVLE